MAYRIVPADEPMLAEIEGWLDIEEANYQRAQEWEEADYEGKAPVRGSGATGTLPSRDGEMDGQKFTVSSLMAVS
jgi:hypothetical protein